MPRCAALASAHNARLLATSARGAFWASHCTERAVLEFLVAHQLPPATVVDVGAGTYTFRRGTEADDSALLHTFKLLGPSAHYYGFEPGHADYVLLHVGHHQVRALCGTHPQSYHRVTSILPPSSSLPFSPPTSVRTSHTLIGCTHVRCVVRCHAHPAY